MIKVIDKIHQSSTYPTQTNVLWDDNGILKIYRNGNWEPIVTSEEYIKSVLEKLIDIEASIQQGLLSSYIHIAYANSSDGFVDFSKTESEDKEYLGIYSDYNIQGSDEPSKYKWSRIKGDKGDKGDDGLTGPNGVDGASGTNTYFHIKYSNNQNGVPMNDKEGIYMGTYVDEIKEDSRDPKKYTWHKIKGADGLRGEEGIPGKNGEDGKTSYLHIAYANSADGIEGFSIIDSTDKLYVGQYVDFEKYDSTEPSRYKWTRIKGVQGDPGIQYYTWLKYADDVEIDKNGYGISGIGISDSPLKEDGTFKKYIGFSYNQVTPDESNDYKDYKWNLSAGADGKDGINGKSGYTWIKYADVYPESIDDVYDKPTDKTEYIGIAANKPSKEETYNPNDYFWSKFKGDKGIQGEKGESGEDGKSYEYIYTLTKDKDTIPSTSGLPSDNVDEFVPTGWDDNPHGVSELNKAEWCCIRTKVKGVWGSWRGPTLWSTFGETGKDGGGLQYIFKRTTIEATPEYPDIPADFITNDQYQERGAYLNVEYSPQTWSDEPQGVGKLYPYEWCCIRKKKDGIWREYSYPALWAKYSQDGTSIKIKGKLNNTGELPIYPENENDCYIINGRLHVWTGSSWSDVGQFKGEDGETKFEWKGSFDKHPLNPEPGWAYRNTALGVIYIYNGVTKLWEIMVSDGEASYLLELSNDSDSINCDYNGTIIGTTLPTCEFKFYHGSTQITSGVLFTIDKDDTSLKGVAIDGNKLKFDNNLSFKNDVVRITITATYGTIVSKKVFTLSKNRPGAPGETVVKYYLVPSTTIVSVDKNGNPNPTSVTVKCYKQEGSNEAVEDTTQTIYYDEDTETPTNTLTYGESIPTKSSMKYICFALKNSKGQYYEIEKVHLVKDGKDGDDGTSINVKGKYESLEALNKAFPNGPEDASDCYVVNKELYVWDKNKKEWFSVGKFEGDSQYLHIAYANSSDGSKDFSTSNGTGRSYIGHYVDTIEDDSETPEDYTWRKYIGTGIDTVTVTYNKAQQDKNAPQIGWSPVKPQVPQGWYLWVKTETTYTDGRTPTIKYETSYNGTDGETGNGISSVVTWYNACETKGGYPNIANQNSGQNSWHTDPDNVGFSSTYKYLYSFTQTTYTDNTVSNTPPILISTWVNDGKTIYPAGLYSENITYTSTETTTPYVIYEKEYYQLNVDSWLGKDQIYTDPKSDIDAGNSNWIKFDKYEAVFANIGLIDNGKFGSAVFSGKYMFSQYGTTTIDGVAPGKYEDFNPNDPFGPNNSFYPTVCFNFETGETWLGKNKITMGAYGDMKLGDFSITEEGLNYEVNNKRLSINKDGITIKNISDGSIVQQISTDGDVLLSDGTTSFMSDKTGKISDGKITWDPNSVKFLNAFTIYSNGDVINNQNAYVDLHSLDSMWPIQNVSVEHTIPHASDIYMYNSVKFTDAHIGTDLHTLTLNLRLSFKIGKVIKIHIANDLRCRYNINVNFSAYNNNIDYDILGTLYTSNGNLVMPMLNKTAKSFAMNSGCTHVFVCEEMSGLNVLHYYGAFDS